MYVENPRSDELTIIFQNHDDRSDIMNTSGTKT